MISGSHGCRRTRWDVVAFVLAALCRIVEMGPVPLREPQASTLHLVKRDFKNEGVCGPVPIASATREPAARWPSSLAGPLYRPTPGSGSRDYVDSCHLEWFSAGSDRRPIGLSIDFRRFGGHSGRLRGRDAPALHSHHEEGAPWVESKQCDCPRGSRSGRCIRRSRRLGPVQGLPLTPSDDLQQNGDHGR